MVTVEVFSTFKEAGEKLEMYYIRNNDASIKMLNELEARYGVYVKSADFHKLHPKDKDEPLTKQEMLTLCTNIGKGKSLTYLIRLYACGLKPYNFDYGMYDPDDLTPHIPQDSIKSLAEEAHKLLNQNNKNIFQIKGTPLFYTVREPYTFSEEEKKVVREHPKYQAFPLERKLTIDKQLNSYVERSLTSEEVKEFTDGYARFFN